MFQSFFAGGGGDEMNLRILFLIRGRPSNTISSNEYHSYLILCVGNCPGTKLTLLTMSVRSRRRNCSSVNAELPP